MKVKAATLIESIVALTIISIAFSISLITFLTVLNSGNLNQRIVAHEILRAMAVETKALKIFVEDKRSKNNMTFVKTIEKVNDKGLLKLTIRASKEDGYLTEEYNEFIISDEKN